jgi:hypothetical protein
MHDYGNVPDDDVSAIQNGVRAAAAVTGRLPASVPAEWREEAFEAVLNGILNDWVLNGTTELTEDDEADLTNLMLVAANTALMQQEEHRDTTFRIVLENVMHDWAQNWNVEEE